VQKGWLAFLYCTHCRVYAPSGHPRIGEWVSFHTTGGCGNRRIHSDEAHMMMSDDIVEGYRMENGLSPMELLAFQGTADAEDAAS